MGDAAVRLAHAIGYTGAGTVEFIVDEFGPEAGATFAFLEMNTRLQVEHGVTELVTGYDLVQWQLRVAAGEPLPARQEDVRARGHAIQGRVYAEDAAHGFLPSTGRLTRFTPPSGLGVRNDLGVYEDAEVSPWYDPLLAKLLVWGADRDEAIRRMGAALEAYVVEGVTTNLPLLRAALRAPAFAAGRTYTDFLDTLIVPALEPDAAATAEAALAAAAFDLARLGDGADPWQAGSWRQAGADLAMAYESTAGLQTVTASRDPEGGWRLTLGDEARRVGVTGAGAGRVLVREGDRTVAYTVREEGDTLRVAGRGREATLRRPQPPSVSAASHARLAGGGPRTLTAPLAGVVVRVAVAAGDRVGAHQPLVVLEAMKMEHTIEAPVDGVVRAVHRAAGDRVQAGDPLIDLDPAPNGPA
ncbi:MAG: biotin/lipoyl-containing protein [Dehalococcoidia bacterium]